MYRRGMTVKPLRADAERTVRAILAAAERLLSRQPSATMEQIAEEAGVARTTVHRRFASRDALIAAMEESALRQVEEAIDAGRPQTAPAAVALHTVTANVIKVKTGWRFTVGQLSSENPATVEALARINRSGVELMERLRDAGLLPADADLEWARLAYHGLLEQAIHLDGEDPDVLAERVVRTLLHGVGTPDRR
jgi:AcrR family transcriptional regulator